MDNSQYKVESLSQLHDQLVASKKKLKGVLDALDFTGFDGNSPLYTSVCGKNNIESVLENIPSEEVLKTMVNHPTKEQKQNVIMQYTGEYKLVRELQNNLDQAKNEAIDTYYLLTQLKPVHLGSAEEYIKENSQLNSWKIYSEEEKLGKTDRNALHPKYRQEMKHKEKHIETPERHLLKEDDLMVHLVFYDSHLKEKQNEFICHGKQSLSQLKDTFYCLIEEIEGEAKSRGSFILIDNIFYNDSRHNKPDLSKEIMDKAAQQGQCNFIALPMEKTKIQQLRVEVGRPYVYRHLVGCDHMIIFNQVRLFDSSLDIRDMREYPINIFEKRLKRRRCEGCDKKFATLLVLDDRMKNGQHGYYCDFCHSDLNLNEQGEPKHKGMVVMKYFHE